MCECSGTQGGVKKMYYAGFITNRLNILEKKKKKERNNWLAQHGFYVQAEKLLAREIYKLVGRKFELQKISVYDHSYYIVYPQN